MKIALSLICFLLIILSCKLTRADWILELQLHNHTYLVNAGYDRDNKQFCCCERCPNQRITCNDTLEGLNNCICTDGAIRYCDLLMDICGAYGTPDEDCYRTGNLGDGDDGRIDFTVESSIDLGNVPLYELIQFEGSSVPADGHINLMFKVYDYDGDNNVVYTDEYSIELPFITSNIFSFPTTYTSRYATAQLTLAYRIYCIEDYYGEYCNMYCVSTNDATGHYYCDCTGNKICLEGYSEPDNNCVVGLDMMSSYLASTTPTYSTTTDASTISSNTADIIPTSSISSNNSDGAYIWFVLTMAFASTTLLSFGIIAGMCFILVGKLCKKKRYRERLASYIPRGYSMKNPHYRSHAPSNASIQNTLYLQRSQVKSNHDYYEQRPPASIPEVDETKLNYTEITVNHQATNNDDNIDDNKAEYDKINRQLL